MSMLKEELVGTAIRRGFALSVDGGGPDLDLRASTSKQDVLDAINAVEEALVYFYFDGQFKGAATIVPGLEPDEEIADCHTALYQYFPELKA